MGQGAEQYQPLYGAQGGGGGEGAAEDEYGEDQEERVEGVGEGEYGG